MIFRVFRYELKQRVLHWSTLLFYALLIFQSLWYTQGFFNFYSGEDLLMNAPIVNYINLAGGGIFMIVIIAISTGTAFYKDIQYKTIEWVYTQPINEKQFFWGRFLSTYFYNLLITFGLVIGMLLVPYVGIAEAYRFGPAPVGQLLHGFALLIMPNVFLLTSMIITAVVFTRKMAAGYLAALLLLVLFLIMQITSSESGISLPLIMMDPFGFVAVEGINDGLSGLEKNTVYLPHTGSFIANRLLWLGISVTLLIVSWSKFSYKGLFGGTKKKGKATIDAQITNKIEINLNAVKPNLSFKTNDFLKKLWSISLLEFKNVVRPVSFKIISGLILFMVIVQNLLWNASYYIGPTFPLTSTMTNFRLTFGVFTIILIMIWSGELFFKDKTVKIDQITDALPVPVWVTQLSRFIAMSGVALVLSIGFIVLGIISQLLKGEASLIEINLYAYDLLSYNWGWLTFVLEIALVFFIAGVTANRYLTHVLSVGTLFGFLFAFELGLAEQARFYYAAVPGLEEYSEISGYGIWMISAAWFFFMWAMLATAFVLLGIYFWKRGTTQNWFNKLKFTSNQLSWGGKVAALCALLLFFVMQSFVIRNTTKKGNFTLSTEEERTAAAYETDFGYLKDMTHPKYAAVDLTFDFYPSDRRASYTATIDLVNTSSNPVDTLYFVTNDQVDIRDVSVIGKPLPLSWEAEEHHQKAYALRSSLLPGDTLSLFLKAVKDYQGFVQSGATPQPDLMFNGSFGHVLEFLPSLGYKYENELDENRERVSQGLPRLTSRMAEIDDEKALQEDALAPYALKLKGTITVGTRAGQIPIAPGKLIQEWEQDGRNYREYQIEELNSFNWYLASSDYATRKGKIGAVKTSILYSAKHPFNLELYEEALHDGVQFVQNELGDYPFDEVRLLEIPHYQDAFYAFPNTVAISEKEGWYADTKGMQEKAYIYHSTVAQIVKHWVHRNTNIANVQGAEMLSVALPETLALQALESKFDREAVQLIIQKKEGFYAKEKNNEPTKEPALIYADGIEYIESGKGTVALYR
ncbi:MAG: ABC transporter permease, partial [Bacteroidota bacterium]